MEDTKNDLKNINGEELNSVALDNKSNVEEVSEQITPEILEELKPEIDKYISTSIQHSGPLPLASEFAKYEKVLPGAANRILKLAEKNLNSIIKEKDYEMDKNNKILQIVENEGKRGSWMAFSLIVLFSIVFLVLTLLNKPIQGFIALIPALVGLARVFNFKGININKEIQDEVKSKNDLE